jgi:cation/acetate symporter
MALLRGESSDRLRRVCGGCALEFLLCIIVLVLLEARGINGKVAAIAVTSVALVLYSLAGVVGATASPLEFHIAGRRISPLFAGMAAAAQWSAPALFLAAPASLFIAGYDGRPMLIGLTGGYVLLAILIAPFVRNCGARTVPGFIAARFGTVAGLIAIVMLLVCSALFLAALLATGVASISRLLATETRIALVIAVGIVLICALAGGMKSVIASQVAQYTVLLIASLALFFLLAAEPFDAPAEAPYDPVLEAVNILAHGLGLVPAPSPRSIPFHVTATAGNLEFIICLMAGTASLPHVIMHPLTTGSMNDGRRWAAWSLLFITILVFALPSSMRLANSAAALESSGIMAGLMAAIAATATAAAASVVLFTMAGALAQGIAKGIRDRDLPATAGSLRIHLARALMIGIAAAVAYGVAIRPLEGASMLAWSFSLAAAGLFPALVLGIWWERVTVAGAVLGMLSGFAISAFYLVTTRYFPQAAVRELGMSALSDPVSGKALVDAARILADPRWQGDVPAGLVNPLASKVGWFNVGNDACGIFGLAAGFAVAIAVSLLGRKPSAESRERIESIRIPRSSD